MINLKALTLCALLIPIAGVATSGSEDLPACAGWPEYPIAELDGQKKWLAQEFAMWGPTLRNTYDNLNEQFKIDETAINNDPNLKEYQKEYRINALKSQLAKDKEGSQEFAEGFRSCSRFDGEAKTAKIWDDYFTHINSFSDRDCPDGVFDILYKAAEDERSDWEDQWVREMGTTVDNKSCRGGSGTNANIKGK